MVALLRQRHPELWLSVSATTRAPRPGEENGVHYFFHSQESFQQLVDQSGLLEWASFAGNCYGTPRQPVEERLAAGVPVLLEIELEGARQVRQSSPDAFQIFLRPPSFEELERRIRGRGCGAPTLQTRAGAEKFGTHRDCSGAPAGPPRVQSPKAPARQQPSAPPPADAGFHSNCPQSWPTPTGRFDPPAAESSPGCGRSSERRSPHQDAAHGWWLRPTTTARGGVDAAGPPRCLCPPH